MAWEYYQKCKSRSDDEYFCVLVTEVIFHENDYYNNHDKGRFLYLIGNYFENWVNNYEIGAKYYLFSANLFGFGEGMRMVGECFERGRGMVKNFLKAREYYCLAIDSQSPSSSSSSSSSSSCSCSSPFCCSSSSGSCFSVYERAKWSLGKLEWENERRIEDAKQFFLATPAKYFIYLFIIYLLFYNFLFLCLSPFFLSFLFLFLSLLKRSGHGGNGRKNQTSSSN